MVDSNASNCLHACGVVAHLSCARQRDPMAAANARLAGIVRFFGEKVAGNSNQRYPYLHNRRPNKRHKNILRDEALIVLDQFGLEKVNVGSKGMPYQKDDSGI